MTPSPIEPSTLARPRRSRLRRFFRGAVPPGAPKAAAVGLAVLTLVVSGGAGALFWRHHAPLPGALLGLVTGALGLVVFGLLTLAVYGLARGLPRLFLGVLGGTIGTFFVLRAVVLNLPDPVFYPGLLLFVWTEALLIGTAWILFSGAYRTLSRSARTVVVSLLITALAVHVAVLAFVFYPGDDPFPGPRPAFAAPSLATADRAEAAAPDLPGLDAPDPALPGPFPVEAFAYGSGTSRQRPEFGYAARFTTEPVDASKLLPEWQGFKKKMRERFWGFGVEALPLNARVWAPVGQGPFPLVLMVHGNHSMEAFSDPGYAYLGELLASRGYIFVSVDENFLNATWSGDFRGREMATRAYLLLKHLEAWRAWSRDLQHPFAGRVDMDRIALIGHSRGGEAVAIAAAYNRLPYYPDDATVPFDFNFNIRSVVAIAPTDKRYHRRVEVADVSYFALQGSYDSDESSYEAIRQYERVRFEGDGFFMKGGLYIHGANHGQFNTVWGRTDSGAPRSWLLNLAPIMSGSDQRQVAKVFISGFLDVTLRGRTEYLPIFRDYRLVDDWLPDVPYVQRYEDSQTHYFADFEEDLDVTTASLPGSRVEAEGLTLWREADLPFRGESGTQRNNGVYLGWSNEAAPANEVAPGSASSVADSSGEGSSVVDSSGAYPSYTVTLPDSFAASRLFTAATRLVFAAAQADEAPVRPDPEASDATGAPGPAPSGTRPLDFTIEVEDRAGATAALPLTEVGALTPVLKVQYLKLGGLSEDAYGKAWEPVLQSFEVPLARFEEVNPAFSADSLRAVRFRFDRARAGVLILDDVGFSTAVAPDPPSSDPLQTDPALPNLPGSDAPPSDAPPSEPAQ